MDKKTISLALVHFSGTKGWGELLRLPTGLAQGFAVPIAAQRMSPKLSPIRAVRRGASSSSRPRSRDPHQSSQGDDEQDPSRTQAIGSDGDHKGTRKRRTDPRDLIRIVHECVGRHAKEFKGCEKIHLIHRIELPGGLSHDKSRQLGQALKRGEVRYPAAADQLDDPQVRVISDECRELLLGDSGRQPDPCEFLHALERGKVSDLAASVEDEGPEVGESFKTAQARYFSARHEGELLDSLGNGRKDGCVKQFRV